MYTPERPPYVTIHYRVKQRPLVMSRYEIVRERYYCGLLRQLGHRARQLKERTTNATIRRHSTGTLSKILFKPIVLPTQNLPPPKAPLALLDREQKHRSLSTHNARRPFTRLRKIFGKYLERQGKHPLKTILPLNVPRNNTLFNRSSFKRNINAVFVVIVANRDTATRNVNHYQVITNDNAGYRSANKRRNGHL